MNKQPTALRLADKLDTMALGITAEQAAAELRRLHEMNQMLLNALQKTADWLFNVPVDSYYNKPTQKILDDARAAIAKAGEVK